MSINLTHPNLPEDKDLANKVLDNASSIDKINAERGWLGGFWGVPSHVPNNIAALLILLLIVTGVLYSMIKINTVVDDKSLSIKDFWSIITPLITLAIGYLFGEKTKPTA